MACAAVSTTYSTQSLPPLQKALDKTAQKIGTLIKSFVFPNQIPLEKLSNVHKQFKEANALLKRCQSVFRDKVSRETSLYQELTGELDVYNLSLEEKDPLFQENPDPAAFAEGLGKVCEYVDLTMESFEKFHEYGRGFEALKNFSLSDFSVEFFQKTVSGMKTLVEQEVVAVEPGKNGVKNVKLMTAEDGFAFVKKYSILSRSEFASKRYREPGILCGLGQMQKYAPSFACVIGKTESELPVYVLKYYPIKDLFEVLCKESKSQENQLSYLEFLNTLENILRTLCFFHKHRLVFGDLKPENILIEEKIHPETGKKEKSGLLADYEFVQKEETFAIGVGTDGYKAPEYKTENLSHKNDIWALGVIVLDYLVFEKVLYVDTTKKIRKIPKWESFSLKVQENIKRKDPKGFLWQLVIECMDTDFKKRPCAQEILEKVLKEKSLF